MDREQSPEVIEQEMEGTRQALTEKVAALEQQVVGTIQEATTTVQETVETVKGTVESVKEAVQETVSSVKEGVQDSVTTVQETVMETFDFTKHVRNRPWACIGGAAAAGFITGLIAFRQRRETQVSAPLTTAAVGPMAAYSPPPLPREYAPPPPPREPGWFDALMDRAGEEAKKLGEMALTTLVASAKESLQDGIPKLIETTIPDLLQQRAKSVEPAAPTYR